MGDLYTSVFSFPFTNHCTLTDGSLLRYKTERAKEACGEKRQDDNKKALSLYRVWKLCSCVLVVFNFRVI